ncbi:MULTISPECIES: metal-sensitive transcriptional regulator [unclassified Lactococcus]|uniref:metal-sensitive transcriptional regulator n=1 Tax=unclassified Lactococcus TaxID=2643510 RepID=UPI0011C88988|nr:MULTISPECIES: metal-sensitive transcriptional regulator [unclassified Lactococcus]MQW23073.1 metal-sensing transcriptional repressor [Lactococcus sp. dk101]TXK44418.1 metal-sensitive transcriptional regulator [Lactococcus sp. dk310]TXK50228.1 metal-sensitive transcriptional regulator [Lactococcus sp. dk322]
MEIYDKKMVNRLKRADGQLHAVLRMMAEEQDCINVITQLTAVRSSIDNLIGVIVAENLKNCLLTSNPDNQDAKIDQAIKMIVKK